MTNNDKDRVIIYRRMINGSKPKDFLYKFKDFTDSELLELLNSCVLPNSISINVLRNTLLNSQVIAGSKAQRNIIYKACDNIKELFEIMSRSEKDLLKYGIFYGFDFYNWKDQMHKYISMSSNPTTGELKMKKAISSYSFQRVFPFVYSLIKRGEKNGKFPRI